ncbi:MAG TPA: hypothetical protein VF527_03500 [Pyrinomonadaceae bacterium]|jgi:hypothetical protein
MKTKITILILSGLVIGVAGFIKTASREQRPITPGWLAKLEDKEKLAKLSREEKIQLAKARGQKRVVVSNIVPTFTQTKNLEQALNDYTVVVVKPVEEKSSTDHRGVTSTWYKLKILERITPLKTLTCEPCYQFEQPPEDMPVGRDEVLLHKIGGVEVVDGIEAVTLEQDFPPFQKNQKYLLFLSIEPSGKVADIPTGPIGAMLVDDNDQVRSMSGKTYGLQREIEILHGNSVPQLKGYAHSRIKM